MCFSKLREWVGTATGKGDRWGRDRVGRSEPAFLSGQHHRTPSINLHCTARGRPTLSAAVVVCCENGHLWPFVLRPVPDGASAGCICLQRLCSTGFVLPVHPLPAMPTALLNVLAPVQVRFAPISFASVCFPCSLPCAPGSVRASSLSPNMFASCKTVPLAAATRACSGSPCAGSILTLLFPAESMILGHGLV